jgi:hypothetical protein
MRTPPTGYASTAVWAAFDALATTRFLNDKDGQMSYDDPWEPYWEFFRDGYSAGLKEQDV